MITRTLQLLGGSLVLATALTVTLANPARLWLTDLLDHHSYQYVATRSEEPTTAAVAQSTEGMQLATTAFSSRPVIEPVTMAVVPFHGNSRALMVKAKLNDMTTGNFVLDTGATYTSISAELAEEMGLDLEHAEKITITTANGRIQVPKVVLDRVTVNGLEARNVEATVIDVRHGSSFSGLLGLSFIKQFRLTIDPQEGRLIFQRL